MPHLLYFVTATPLIYMAPDIPVRHNTKQSKVSLKNVIIKIIKFYNQEKQAKKMCIFFFFIVRLFLA